MQGSARIDELRQKFHENPRRYFAPLANEYRKAGDPEQAIAICRAHLAQQPAHMSGHVVYAQALYDAGRMDESRVVFEKALSLDPDNAIVLRQLGDISRQKGDTAEARHWYTRALDTDPHDREIAAYIAELTEPLTEPVLEEAAPVTETPHLEAVTEEIVAAPVVPDAEAVAEETAEPVEAIAEEAEAAPVEELTAPEDVEVEIPTTEEPLALTDMPGFEADEPLFAADEDIELFPDSSSPFVTRTMADLYARQGYNDQALEVYRKLAADNPHDQEIADRIRELSPTEAAPPSELPPQAESHEADSLSEAASPSNEFSEPTDDSSHFGAPPIDETAGISSGESLAETPPSDSSEKPFHFSDSALGDGDEWDADSWAAGFSSEETEVVPFDFVASNETVDLSDDELTASSNSLELADDELSPLEVAGETTAEVTEEAAPVRHRADSSLIAETDRTGEFAAAETPLGILNEAREEIRTEDYYQPFDESEGAEPPEEPIALTEREEPAPSVEELTPVVEEESPYAAAEEESPYAAAEEESPYAEREEESPAEPEHFVAYSPQPPDDEDLPHYTPVGPTIREFFATLGAYQPPENGSGASFTARAAVPDIDAEPQSYEIADTGPEDASATEEIQPPPDEFPLVTDAFANLFPDSPVSDEDSKAAFALSGALSSQPNQPAAKTIATPPTPTPAVEPQPAATQESEEDIRRFREWLDGLAES